MKHGLRRAYSCEETGNALCAFHHVMKRANYLASVLTNRMSIYQHDSEPQPSVVRERDLESAFIEKLRGLKYTDRPAERAP